MLAVAGDMPVVVEEGAEFTEAPPVPGWAFELAVLAEVAAAGSSLTNKPCDSSTSHHDEHAWPHAHGERIVWRTAKRDVHTRSDSYTGNGWVGFEKKGNEGCDTQRRGNEEATKR